MVEFERLTADVEARREKASNQLQINRDNISRFPTLTHAHARTHTHKHTHTHTHAAYT